MRMLRADSLGKDAEAEVRDGIAIANPANHRSQPASEPNTFAMRRPSFHEEHWRKVNECRLEDNAAADLLVTIEEEYQTLVANLRRTLGSSDCALEALHDAYLRLANRSVIGEVHRPLAYIRQAAINLAKNRRRRDEFIKPSPAAAASQLADEAPDPERVAGARSEMAQALSLLDQLPSRRRKIFLARWRDDMGQAEIAAQFGLHKRTVQKELARAEAFLRSNLAR